MKTRLQFKQHRLNPTTVHDATISQIQSSLLLVLCKDTIQIITQYAAPRFLLLCTGNEYHAVTDDLKAENRILWRNVEDDSVWSTFDNLGQEETQIFQMLKEILCQPDSYLCATTSTDSLMLVFSSTLIAWADLKRSKTIFVNSSVQATLPCLSKIELSPTSTDKDGNLFFAFWNPPFKKNGISLKRISRGQPGIWDVAPNSAPCIWPTTGDEVLEKRLSSTIYGDRLYVVSSTGLVSCNIYSGDDWIEHVIPDAKPGCIAEYNFRVAFDGYILLVGGYDGNNDQGSWDVEFGASSNLVRAFDCRRQEWKSGVASLNIPRAAASGIVIDGYGLLVMGGWHDRVTHRQSKRRGTCYLDSAELLTHVDADYWQIMPSWKTPRPFCVGSSVVMSF